MTITGDDAVFSQLLYRSRSAISSEAGGKVIAEILFASRRTNTKQGVTGALLLHDDTFVQFLEGPQPALSHLYARICLDKRHGDIELLASQDAQSRVFEGWSMALVGEGGEADMPLSASANTLTVGVATPISDEQSQILTRMRNHISSGFA